ncbi:MAG: hypothetical protein M5R36_19695 [Deltaproteobacteria bacterium]|nr:hypothetical protein [Deltaproteobacteria bacterium]
MCSPNSRSVIHVADDAWYFAAGSEDAVRETAAVLGIRYRRLPDGSFNHSAVISLLDKDGMIVERADGLAAPLEPLTRRIENDTPSP